MEIGTESVLHQLLPTFRLIVKKIEKKDSDVDYLNQCLSLDSFHNSEPENRFNNLQSSQNEKTIAIKKTFLIKIIFVLCFVFLLYFIKIYIKSFYPLNSPFGRNFYTEYEKVEKQNSKVKFVDLEPVIFVIEDARFTNIKDNRFSTFSRDDLLKQTLEIRFTVYNNNDYNIRIFNFQAVIYSSENWIFVTANSRETIDISPQNPFILQNKTYDIKPGQRESFLLRYNARIGKGINDLQQLIGILIYYHLPSGEIGKIKSENIFLLKFNSSVVETLDKKSILNTIEKVRQSDNDFSSKKPEYEDLLNILEIFKKHNNL